MRVGLKFSKRTVPGLKSRVLTSSFVFTIAFMPSLVTSTGPRGLAMAMCFQRPFSSTSICTDDETLCPPMEIV
jgi:hypothetical protein